MAVAALVPVLAGTVAACSDDDSGGDQAQEADSTTEAPAPALGGDDLRLNELQVIGSHNSYHLPAEEPLAGAIAGLLPGLWTTIDYGHRPLPEQLEDHGIRQFELDVVPDPDGGLYATPAGSELVGMPPPDDPRLAEPGFKVQHVPDIDFNATCVTLVECLTQIEEWSSANPTHLPVMVMVETKGDDVTAGAGDLGVDLDSLGVEFASPPPMTPELFEELEAEVLSVFDRDDILTPDDVRGDADTLEEAVLTEGWPTVGDSRGKVMFSLVDTGESRDIYTEDAPSLQDRVFFTSSEPGRDDAAFVRFDDPTDDPEALRSAAEAGYLIRTRTDEPGVHAPAGDATWRDAALASGGHFLSTDYYVAHATSGFVVELPGGAVAVCNPVTAPSSCAATPIEE